MSNAFDKASLVMLPHAYEEGKVYSLKPTDRSGDFTYSRGTDTATRVGEDGYIKKEYANLLEQSNSFDTTWTTSNASVTGGQAGYDGLNDAWLLSKSGAGGRVIQSISVSGVQTFSFYAKANTSSWVRVLINPIALVFFDLSNGSVGTNSYSGFIDAKIENVGNGWYRCSVIANGSSTLVNIAVADADNVLSGTSGNIYIQDAQINQGLVAYPYLETTTAPVYGGLTDDMPRLDYSGGATCPSLLLEPSRTNLMSHSEYAEGNQFFGNLTAEYNATTSPEGLQNGVKITATGTGIHQYGSYPVVSSGVGVVGSVFVKADATEYVQLYFGGSPSSGSPYANFFIGDNPSVEREIDLTASIEDYGNGWLRLIVKQTTDASGGLTFAVMPIPNGTTNRAASYTANGESIFTYGLQLEQDATYPTSYIPTYGVSQTRLVDSATASNVASLIGQTEGTIFIDVNMNTENGDVIAIKPISGSFYANGIGLGNFNGTLRLIIYQPSVLTQVFYPLSVGGRFKFGIRYDSNNLAFFVNGSKFYDNPVTIDFSVDLNEISLFDSATTAARSTKQNNQTLLFPTALTDSECIALTTIV